MTNAKTLSLVRDNASRLLKDAHRMVENGSHATALALSIFAIEEAGKYLIHAEDHRLRGKAKLSHSEKQSVLGEKFQRLFLFETLEKLVADFEKHLRENGDAQSLNDYLSLSPKDRMATLYSSLSLNESWLHKEIRRAVGEDETGLNYAQEVKSGKVDRKREQALYVDLAVDGSTRPSPYDITADEAALWIERAEFAVYITNQILLEDHPGDK